MANSCAYSHLYTQEEVARLLLGFSVKIVGIGTLSVLFPRRFRRKYPKLCRRIMSRLAGIEEFLGQKIPRLSAHLFVIASKE